MPVDMRRELPAVLFMGVLFLASIGLALAFSATFDEAGIRAFEDPEDLANPLIYLGIVVVFTIGILLIAKYGRRILIKYVILGSILLTIYYVAWPLLAKFLGVGDPIGPAEIVAGLLAAGLTALLWTWPEWYIIDSAGVLVAAGAAGIFGISFGLLPCIILLVAFAVYDAIAVYRTRHMLALADSILELRLPIMFVVPKSRGYSFLEETRRVKDPTPEDNEKPREAMFMGLGDAVIPGILVVSAYSFLPGSAALTVALATLAGSLAGFGVLMYYVMKGDPHAGLPLLNGGALLGFFAALLPLYGLAPLNPF